MCLNQAHPPMVSELIGKYIWLIQTLSAAGEHGLSLHEISDRYERRYDQPYSRRTFNNHRLAVSDVFGIDIECDRKTNRYFIPFGEEALDDEKSIGWLIDTFTVNNLLALGKGRLSGRVSVEEVPSGHKYLTTVMQAMEEGRELEITYGKYSSSFLETLHVQPFAVKEYERRWYLVGSCNERATGGDNSDMDSWRVYGLDRIVSMKETGISFKMPKGFDVDSLFSESFGIFFPRKGQKSVTVRFKAPEEEARYLRDLPLHHSQAEEGLGPDGQTVFRLRVIPDRNLVMEFCKLAGRVEVIEPEDVRSAVRDELGKGYDNYKIKT